MPTVSVKWKAKPVQGTQAIDLFNGDFDDCKGLASVKATLYQLVWEHNQRRLDVQIEDMDRLARGVLFALKKERGDEP